MPAAAAVRRSRRRDASKTPSIVPGRLATSPLPGTVSRESAATSERAFPLGALALTAALPFLFLHVEYEPSFSVGLGSTTATASLSDVCVWIVALVALWTLVRQGAGRLRAGAPIWIAGA